MISVEFPSLRHRRLPGEMSLAARSKERWLFSQATLSFDILVALRLHEHLEPHNYQITYVNTDFHR